MLNLCESFWLKQHFKIDCNCSIELGFLMGQWKKDSKIVYLSVNGGERERQRAERVRREREMIVTARFALLEREIVKWFPYLILKQKIAVKVFSNGYIFWPCLFEEGNLNMFFAVPVCAFALPVHLQFISFIFLTFFDKNF